MALPFQNKRLIPALLMKTKPSLESEDIAENDGKDAGLESAMSQLLKGIETRSPSLMAEAFEDAFEICEAYPHEEGEHIDEDGEVGP